MLILLSILAAVIVIFALFCACGVSALIYDAWREYRIVERRIAARHHSKLH